MAGYAAPAVDGLLAEAGRLLASSLDLDDTLRTAARLGVPDFAGWAAVDLLAPDGSYRRIVSHEQRPVPAAVIDVVASGRPAMVTGDPSWIIVPLAGDGGRVIGALSLQSAASGGPFGEADLPVALELADRCSQAILNAQRYEEAQSGRALLDTVFAAAPIGLALFDAEGRYVLVNERLSAIDGLPGDELVGRTALEVLGPDHACVPLIERVFATGETVTDAGVTVGDRVFSASYAPVVVDGRVLGAVAGVVETTERHRAAAAMAAAEARFRAAVDSSMVGVARGRDDTVTEANDAFLRLLGRTRADVASGALTIGALTPKRWAPVDAVKGRELLEGGRIAPYEKELLGADGRGVPVLVSATMVPGEEGEWLLFVVDLSERKAVERERERLHARTSRVQAVTERLSAALTEAQVAAVILGESMAATGASCAVLGLRTDDDVLRIGHRQGIEGSAPHFLPLDSAAPMPTAVRTGEPVLLRSRAEWLECFPMVPPRTDFEAFAAVPLLFEGGVLGAMGIGYPDRRAFDCADVDMLLAIARQGAQALERARLYEERAYVARTLQQGLLPRALPRIPNLDVAVLYRPVGDGSEVGGDFYDVVALRGGAWLAAIGDICGKGAAAAVLTGVVRSTLRALALRDARPSELLAGVSEALVREESPQALAAVTCARIGRRDGGFDVRLAAGGQPPPLVLRAAAGVETVDAGGTMLGVAGEPRIDEVDVHLRPGDLLLLYTDGVIDARPSCCCPFGELRLRAALGAAAGRDAQGALDSVDAAVRAYAPGPPRDDTALLALRASP